MTNRIFHFLFLLLLAGSSLMARADMGNYTVASEGAWCWFADPRATHYRNPSGSIDMSYLGYIDVHGNIRATQFNWLTNEKSDILVRSFFQPDDHNNPTFLVLPDERVLIIYSRHTDEPAFYYRVSVKPGDITQLGEEKRLATANNTTYPSPFLMSEDPTHWYLCWRGISWHPTIARLTLPDENGDCHFDWGPYQMVQSTGARPYAKYYSNGKDKLYVSYTTGHPDNENPNWLYFNVINIKGEPTLEDIEGHRLSTIKDGPFRVNKSQEYKSTYPLTVVDAPAQGTRDWVWQIALDQQERPRIAMVKINDDKSHHQYYYARWTGSQWSLTDVCDGGGKFHPSDTERCYSGGEALDPQNPGTMYVSRPTPGEYGNVHEIWKYTISDDGRVSSSEQLTRNSTKNNVRPYMLPNSQGSPLRLTWMQGDYAYWIVCSRYPAGYPTSIQCDYDTQAMLPTKAAGKGWTYVTTLTPQLQQFTLGAISYSVDATSHRPILTINGQKYESQSQLRTSDGWQFCPATTDGKEYPSLGAIRIALTYDAKAQKLTVYRNGLIDQVINTKLDAKAPRGAQQGCLPQHLLQ